MVSCRPRSTDMGRVNLSRRAAMEAALAKAGVSEES